MKLAPMMTTRRAVGRRGDQCPAVGERSQIVDLREIAAGNAEPDRRGTGGEEQRAEAMPGCRRRAGPREPLGVDRDHAGAELQLDPVLSGRTRADAAVSIPRARCRRGSLWTDWADRKVRASSALSIVTGPE